MVETIVMVIVVCILVLVLGLQIQIRNFNQKFKELLQHPHNHLICSICGNIVNIEMDVDKSLISPAMAYVPNVKIREISLIENEYTT